MANSVLSAVLGFVFWVVLARLYPAQAVGLGSALLSAASLLAFAATLGLGIGLIRFLPGAGSGAAALINSCLTLSGLAGVAMAVIFLMGLPLWSPALTFVRGTPIFAAAFIAFVSAGAITGLLSEVFVALRRAEFTLIQGFLVSLLKLTVVVVTAKLFQVFGIFASWGVAVAIALGVSLFLILPRLHPGYRPVPSLRRQVSNELVHFSFVNYASTGLWSAPAWLLPILVVNRLGGEANAYFFMTWAMASLLFAIAGAISTSLFAEGSHQEDFLPHHIRRSLRLILLLLLPAILVMAVAGDRLLLVFGRGYSEQGTKLLYLLVASAVPVSVNVLYLGIARVHKRLKDVILMAAAIALGTLVLSYVLITPLGILGPGVGWLVSHSLVAVAVLPSVRRLLRTGPTAVPSGEG